MSEIKQDMVNENTQVKSSVKDKNEIKAILYVLLGNFLWVFAYIYPNQNQIDFYETCYARGLGMSFIGYFLCKKQNKSTSIQNAYFFKKVTFRSFIMLCFSWSVAFSQFYLPLPIVHTICGGGPIFIFIVDYYMNGIKINMKQFIGIIIGIIGLIFTVNGGLIMVYFNPQYKIQTNFTHYKTENPFLIFLVSVQLVIINILWAYGTVLIKSLVGIHPVQIIYHYGIQMTLLSSVLYCISGRNNLSLSQLMITFFITGIPTGTTAYLHTVAVKMVKDTGILMILCFSQVIMGYLMSIFYYNESQNPVCTVGVFFIIAGVVKAIYNKTA